MTRFTKIKRTSEGKIYIEYQVMNKQGYWDDFSMKSFDEPTPSFDRAFDAMIPHVIEMCEMPENDHTDHPYTIKGFSMSYSGDNDTLGVTMTTTRALEESNTPLVLNTPHKIKEPYVEGGDDTQVMGGECLQALQAVFAEAQDYLDGKRKQGDLFAEPKLEVV